MSFSIIFGTISFPIPEKTTWNLLNLKRNTARFPHAKVLSCRQALYKERHYLYIFVSSPHYDGLPVPHVKAIFGGRPTVCSASLQVCLSMSVSVSAAIVWCFVSRFRSVQGRDDLYPAIVSRHGEFTPSRGVSLWVAVKRRVGEERNDFLRCNSLAKSYKIV